MTNIGKAELEKQLDQALEGTFPASDPISIGDVTTSTPDRPLHRKPAAIDQALVERLAREVADSHEPADKTGAA
jgi:hypothetical protein